MVGRTDSWQWLNELETGELNGGLAMFRANDEVCFNGVLGVHTSLAQAKLLFITGSSLFHEHLPKTV